MNVDKLRAQLKDNGIAEDKIEEIVKATTEDAPGTPEVSLDSIKKALDDVKSDLGQTPAITPELMAEEIQKAVAAATDESEKKLAAISAATDQLVKRNEGRFDVIQKAIGDLATAIGNLGTVMGANQELVVKALGDKPSVDVAALTAEIKKGLLDSLPAPEPKAVASMADVVAHPGDVKPKGDAGMTKEAFSAVIQKAVDEKRIDGQRANQARVQVYASARRPEDVLREFNIQG